MLGGGTLRGNGILVAGPVGSGKSTMAVQFIAEGVAHGEPGVVVIFEETAPKYLDQAKALGVDLEDMARRGLLEVVYVRPLDLSMDETLYAIQAAVDKIGARRVILDSISGLEAALAPAFKEDFLESLYRLLGALTGAGVTILLTVEVTEPYNDMRFTPHPISFLTHDIVLQRYYEFEGELRTFLTVIKTRARGHSHEMRDYEVTGNGLVVGDRLSHLTGLITAVPEIRNRRTNEMAYQAGLPISAPAGRDDSCRQSSCEGQFDRTRGALTHTRAVDLNRPAMQFDQDARNREAQPEALTGRSHQHLVGIVRTHVEARRRRCHCRNRESTPGPTRRPR